MRLEPRKYLLNLMTYYQLTKVLRRIHKNYMVMILF